ncbi:hypothetical protein PT110_07015 [Erysipelothrix rhusiopathiae]|nr:hypothetical protein [Erysipelothrix rhusiopathiae]
MLQNNRRYVISQARIKKTPIFVWIWYEFILLVTGCIILVALIFSCPFPVSVKFSTASTAVTIIFALFAQVDELRGSPFTVLKKLAKYYFGTRHYLYRPRKERYVE